MRIKVDWSTESIILQLDDLSIILQLDDLSIILQLDDLRELQFRQKARDKKQQTDVGILF